MKALLCSKRGNSKYVARIRERFSVLDGMFDNNHAFFKKADADAGKRVYTPALLDAYTHNSNVKKAKWLDINDLDVERWYMFGYGGFKSLATCTIINNEELWVYELTRLPDKVARYAALFVEKSNNPEKISIGNHITDSFLRLQSHRQSVKKTIVGSVSKNLKSISQSRASSGMLVNNF